MQTERLRRGLNLKQVADQSGISTSTLYRLESGAFRSIDADTEIRVKQWIGLPISIGTIRATGDLFADIQTVLQADPNLSPKARFALFELLYNAYKTIVNFGAGE